MLDRKLELHHQLQSIQRQFQSVYSKVTPKGIISGSTTLASTVEPPLCTFTTQSARRLAFVWWRNQLSIFHVQGGKNTQAKIDRDAAGWFSDNGNFNTAPGSVYVTGWFRGYLMPKGHVGRTASTGSLKIRQRSPSPGKEDQANNNLTLIGGRVV